MKNQIQKTYKAISQWSFDKKLSLMLTLLLVFSNLGNMALTSGSAIRSLREKSIQFVQAQQATINQILETEFRNIISDMETTAFSESVKNYISYQEQSEKNSLVNINDAYGALNALTSQNDLVDYAAIICRDRSNVMYSGEVWTNPDFRKKIMENYEASTQKIEKNIRFATMQKVFYPDEKVLNLYIPMNQKYDIRPNQPVAVMVVGIGENNLKKYLSPTGNDLPTDVWLVDGRGQNLIANTLSEKDENIKLDVSFQGEQGSTAYKDKLYMYQKIPGPEWYTISAISMSELYRDTRNTAIFLSLMIALLCILAIFFARALCRRMYHPMKEIGYHMEVIASGQLSDRMEEHYSGVDFQNLARGFNSMAQHIEELMEQVLNEQHELEQSKLNALQSQIKPHFLYNTLECIHWQALAEGNEEVSRMVKALANYYRLCLSHGQDIITLGQEIAHTKNYLIIQNMRYDDIVKEEILVEPRLEDVLIPKMTLQPLVENAIYHGLKVKTGRKGTIQIQAWEEDNYCVVSVSDNGEGMTQEQCENLNQTISQLDSKKGYGVRNVHKRIEILFGKGYGLRYSLRPMGGVEVKIYLPHLQK